MIEVILPCLDEAAALPWVLGRMPDRYRALVVDNGSRDGSADVAASYGARVVREDRRGFGAACHAGLLAATGDVVCFMDADASLDPAELPTLVGRLDGADLVLGRRRPVGRGAWPVHARVGNAVVARRFGLRDIGPMRAARREMLLGLGLTDRRSGYPLEMVVRAVRHGWRLAEIDVAYHPRTGRSKVTGTVHGTLQAVRDMRRVLEAT
jgi:glycosyltransferase involved in cell wall biosynthesis